MTGGLDNFWPQFFPGVDAESAVRMGRFMLHCADVTPDPPAVLYRHFDAQGTLLYVGICQSRQRKTRQTQHAGMARWWAFVERTEFEDHEDVPTARTAEVAAIERERPIFNLDRNGPPREQRRRELAYIRSRICEHAAIPEGAMT